MVLHFWGGVFCVLCCVCRTTAHCRYLFCIARAFVLLVVVMVRKENNSHRVHSQSSRGGTTCKKCALERRKRQTMRTTFVGGLSIVLHFLGRGVHCFVAYTSSTSCVECRSSCRMIGARARAGVIAAGRQNPILTPSTTERNEQNRDKT